MLEKLRKFARFLNERGIPLPLFRDPKTGSSSVSLTMMVISFVIVVVGLIGKMSKFLDINLTEGLTFFGVTSALYFSRRIGINDTTVSNDPNSTTVIKNNIDVS